MLGKNKLDNKSIKEAGPYIGLGTQLAATVILMVLLGKWIDESYGTKPIFILVFSLFGTFAGLYNFIKTVLELNKKNKIEKNSNTD